MRAVEASLFARNMGLIAKVRRAAFGLAHVKPPAVVAKAVKSSTGSHMRPPVNGA